jgi:hypothetical protein
MMEWNKYCDECIERVADGCSGISCVYPDEVTLREGKAG